MAGGVLLGLALLLLPGATAAGVRIDHAPLRCVVAGRSPALSARIEPAAEIGRARVYFRSSGGRHWYFVEMRPGEGGYGARLPAPLAATPAIVYYLEAVDRAFAAARTAEFVPVVAQGTGACENATAAAPVGSIVVGAAKGAPALPEGFSPANVVAAGGAAGTASGGGATTALLVGAGLAAAGAAVAVAASGGGGDSGPPSTEASRARDDDGDGLSENGGDCNDANAAVRPGGGFDFQVTFGYGGFMTCLTPLVPSTIRITNNDCAPLSYVLISHQQIFGAPTQPDAPRPAATVAPGATVTRMEYIDPAAYFLCCRSGPCQGNEVESGEESWTITTEAGSRTVPNPFSFVFGTCPQCG
jgi:hypothetical protein